MRRYRIYRDDAVVIDHPVDQNQITQLMNAEALRFIGSNTDRPFFLFLAHPMPHEPTHASEAFRGRSAAGLYGDSVEEIDWSLGELFSTLQGTGIDDRTLVIFTSDNGPWWQGNPGFNRGRKMMPFEGGYKVPFIARWPGVLPSGFESDEISMNFDIFPLCLEVARVQPPQDRIIDGRNILPMLQGEAPSPHETLYFFKGRNLLGVRHHSWKYLRRHMTDNGGYITLSQGPFLFNLQTDPNESYSLLESEPNIARNLAGLLDEFDTDIRENIRGWK